MNFCGFLCAASVVPAALCAELTLPELTGSLDRQAIDSIAGYLESPAFTADYRTQFRPLKRATALQPGTLAEPRIIAYGPSARFIQSFNGGRPGELDHGHMNQSLEIMAWNEGESLYDFYHLEFHPGQKPGYHLSERNPETCVGCHLTRLTMGIPAKAKAFTDEDTRWFLKHVIEGGEASEEAVRRYRALDWTHHAPDRLDEYVSELEKAAR